MKWHDFPTLVDLLLKAYIATANDYLSKEHIAKARGLVSQNNVLHATIGSNDTQASGDLIDGKLYAVVLHVEDHFAQSRCTCGTPICCVHGLAIIYYLQQRLQRREIPTKPIVKAPKAKKPRPMKNTSAGSYRAVPGLLTSSEVNRVLDSYMTTHRLQLSGCQAHLQPSGEVTFTAKAANRVSYYMGPSEQSACGISVKHIAGKPLQVKCLECSSTTPRFCEHQSAILASVKDVIACILDQKYQTYEEIIADAIRDKGLTPQQIDEYYEVGVFPTMTQLVPKQGSGLIQPVTLKYSRRISGADNRMAGFLTKLEAKEKLGYGVLWSRDKVSYIQGKLAKDGTTIKSNIAVIEMEKVPDRSLVADTFEIFNHLEVNDIDGALAICKRDLATFSSYQHFWYPGYVGYDNLRKSNIRPISISNDTLRLRATLTPAGALMRIDLQLFTSTAVVAVQDISAFVDFMLIDKANNAYVLESMTTIHIIQLLGARETVIVPSKAEGADQFFDALVMCDEVVYPVLDEYDLTGGTLQLWLDQVGRSIVMQPLLVYHDELFDLGGKYERIYIGEGKVVRAASSDVQRFESLLEEILPGAVAQLRDAPAITIRHEDFYRGDWFLSFFEIAHSAGVSIFGEQQLTNFNYSTHRADVKMSISSGIDWFDAEVDMAFGDLVVPAKEWISSIKSGSNYVQLSDGKRGVLPQKWVDRLRKLADVAEVSRDGTVQVSKLMFNVIDDLFEGLDDDDLRAEIDTKKEALASYDSNKQYHLPKGIHATLRPYQLQGYQWMKFLEEYGFGGCLADDMGLGKTIQVIAILLDQKDKAQGTSLVVIPRSLLFNWAAEIDKFAPQLTYQIHHGTSRDKTLESYPDDLDIIISTYDTVGKDIEAFSAVTYNYVILDESQAIKNPSSQRYKAMRLLKGRRRLAMTGTPIENNTFDLYAQLSFLNPGLLGSAKAFKDRYATPIDGSGDIKKLELLKRLIHPFMLRRTKAQVATDLPDKTETIIYCEMDKVQRKLYNDLKTTIRQDIEGLIESGGVNRAKFKILDGLLRLRQICNAPELVNSKLPKRQKASCKIDTLIEHIQDLGSHKALVFSQFVGMLSIIRDRFDALGITYAYLDGSTRDRQSAVSDFMDTDDCQVFLISIKAGNTGLNLTKADYVYIVDPWWNPAVEAQAIDRTHRIGQDQHVFAYKMIVKDTIEDKIVELQNRKKKLAQDLIQVDESVFKALDKQELMALFE